MHSPTRRGLFAVLWAGAASAGIVPRQNPSTTVDVAISSLAASAVSSASLQPYIKPSQKVEQVLALGDSFASGVGSNGAPDRLTGSYDCARFNSAWPVQLSKLQGWTSFNQDLPALTFGACSGAKMADLVSTQLNQGTPNPNLEFTRIGKPQVAVLTVSGNDAKFSDVIKACVYRPKLNNFDCTDTLNTVGSLIRSSEFKQDLINTLVQITHAGRAAGGANPPESFQVYVAGYVQFWNDDDPGCNNADWSWWPSWITGPAPLTTEVRSKMNQLVDQVNGVISDAATELADFGVFYVDGFQSSFDTHRFCEPASLSYLNAPVGAQTWFWHQESPGYLSGTEGPTDGSSAGAQNLTQLILDELIPDNATRASISESNPPWNINPAFDNETALLNALDQVSGNGTNALALGPYIVRTFHPKGTGYRPVADAFLASIQANRNSINAASALSSASASTSIPPASSSAPPTSSPAPPTSSTAPPASSAAPPTTSPTLSYATGSCCFHVDEWEDCNPDSDDLYANITLVDNNKNIIYQTPQADLANGGLGEPINNGNDTTFQGPLPNPISINGEHENDYIQFDYGSLSWTSRTTSGPATCSNGGWNPRDGPGCYVFTGYQPDENQIDCCFPC